MAVLERIASASGRRDDALNIALAEELAANSDAGGIEVLVEHLADRDRNVANDCIKTLCEIGRRRPELVAPHVSAFIDLLASNNNRLRRGAMIALMSVAPLKYHDIYDRLYTIVRAIENETSMAVGAGIAALALVASRDISYNAAVTPHLIGCLQRCTAASLPAHAERILPAVTPENRESIAAALRKREGELTAPQRTRLRKALAHITG